MFGRSRRKIRVNPDLSELLSGARPDADARLIADILGDCRPPDEGRSTSEKMSGETHNGAPPIDAQRQATEIHVKRSGGAAKVANGPGHHTRPVHPR